MMPWAFVKRVAQIINPFMHSMHACAAVPKRPCGRGRSPLFCASQQHGIAELSVFLGRFLPKLGGPSRDRLFFASAVLAKINALGGYAEKPLRQAVLP
jgi:hypothetical protein